tara:strand:- start:1251 stop:2099 length:849 start_codon:yes stop_codon:yes gene_type:complete
MIDSKTLLLEMIQKEISSMAQGNVQGGVSTSGASDEQDELRSLIRELSQHILFTRKTLNENEKVFRNVIKNLISEVKKDVEDTPYDSTAINLLEELLKQILPGVEIDFKTLTTSNEQRTSYRANLLDAVSKLLGAEDVNAHAPIDIEEETLEEVEIQIDDEEPPTDDDKFIDISDEEPVEEEEPFGIEGQEETGRNMAAKSYDNVEKNIVDAYSILSDDEDRKIFRDYLITNLKLYFDKWESELNAHIDEPTTDVYEKEKNQDTTTVQDIEGLSSDIESELA